MQDTNSTLTEVVAPLTFELLEEREEEEATAMAEFIETNPAYGENLLHELRLSVDETTRFAENNYMGCYDSFREYLEDIWNDIHPDCQALYSYLDWDMIERDYSLDYMVIDDSKYSDRVHIFTTA